MGIGGTDGACSATVAMLPTGTQGYASDVKVWRGQGWAILRGTDGGTLVRVDTAGTQLVRSRLVVLFPT